MANDIKLTIGSYVFDPVPPQVNLGSQSNRTDSRKSIGVSSTGSLDGVLIAPTKGIAGISTLLGLKDTMESALLNCSDCQFMSLSCNGVVIFSNFIRVVSIDFQPSPDNWTITIPYTIQIEWEPRISGCSPCLISTTDSIEISQIEDSSPYVLPSGGCSDITNWYSVTRTLSAVGRQCCADPSGYSATINSSGIVEFSGSQGPTIDGWQVARTWVLDNADCIPVVDCSGVYASNNVSGLQFFNRSRVKSYSCSAGSYNLTDTWVAADSTTTQVARETFNVDISTSNNECITTYAISGTVNGLEVRACDNTLTKSKFQSAQEYFDTIKNNFITKIECLHDVTCPINTSPVTTSVSKSPGAGTISYNYTYTDRPQLIAGSLSESLNINESIPSPIINEQRILGRKQSIKQFCGAMTSRQKNVQFSATIPRNCATAVTCPEFLDNYLDFSGLNTLLCCIDTQLRGVYDDVYKTSDEINWDPYTCAYSRSVSWIYEDCNEILSMSGLC